DRRIPVLALLLRERVERERRRRLLRRPGLRANHGPLSAQAGLLVEHVMEIDPEVAIEREYGQRPTRHGDAGPGGGAHNRLRGLCEGGVREQETGKESDPLAPDAERFAKPRAGPGGTRAVVPRRATALPFAVSRISHLSAVLSSSGALTGRSWLPLQSSQHRPRG